MNRIMDPVNELVSYSVRLKYDALPEEEIESVKKRVLDTLGAAIAGSSTDECKKLCKLIRTWGGREESHLIIYGDRVPAPMAALCNCTMARVRELDDVHEIAGTHVGASIIPSALAIAGYIQVSKNRPVDGKTFILSVILGSDLICRLRMAGREEGPEMGWVGETYAPIAVPAMGAKMLGFSETKTMNAMGIGYAQCSGNAQANVDGAFTVSLQQGLGAKAGVLALLLADEGLTGAKDFLEGKYGLYPLYLRGNFNHEILTNELGKRFEIANTTTKFYPCCQGNHAAIFGALKLTEEYGIKSKEIDEVRIHTNTFFANILGTPEKVRPMNVHDAQFSYFFTVALALVKGGVTLGDFTEEGIKDTEVLKVGERVRVFADPGKDRIKALIPPIDVEIIMKDKSRYRRTVECVKGHPNNPATLDDYIKKFDDCVRYSAKPLAKRQISEVKQMIEQLDKLDDVTLIINQLS
jgi:2-methylcitrate dehydratase PrpD